MRIILLNKYNTQSLQKSRGFSLIELLVSISLFTIVLTVAVGGLLVLIDANARAQNMQQVMTELSFAIDSISREVRTGRGLYCSNTEPSQSLSETTVRDCNGSVYLSVVEGGESLTGGQSSKRITFHYDSANEQVRRRVGDGDWFPLTADDVHITEMFFYVSDSDTGASGNEVQANATIYIEGYVGEKATVDSSFSLQTTISRRIIDFL